MDELEMSRMKTRILSEAARDGEIQYTKKENSIPLAPKSKRYKAERLPSYLQSQVDSEIIKSAKPEFEKEIRRRESELRSLKRQRRSAKISRIAGNLISKITKGRVSNRQVVRASPTATVVVPSDVATTDRSRFFKNSFQEDRRQLFFR